MERRPHTIAEKILAVKSGRPSVVPGEIVEAKVDVAMAHEALAQVVAPFDKMGAGKVWAPEKVVVPIDHWVPASTESAAKLHKACREFVNKYAIPHFYDVGRQGICHQILVEEGFVLPGDLVVGTDSHTNMAGALGSFACGVGPTEMAAVFSTGDIWLRVPETMRMNVTGKLHFPVASKDLVLKIIGTIGDDGARYRAVEFTGPGIASMAMWERFTLTNMTTEMGAKAGIIPPDAETMKYLSTVDVKNDRGGEVERYAGLATDEGARLHSDLQFDLDTLEPLVALPSSPENIKPVRDVETGQVDQIFIGSCTNARLEDLRIVANVLKGSKVKRGTRLIVFPASTSIYNQALREGIIDIIVDAGGIFNAASCGACFGGMGGVLAAGETCISTSNRNYVGRMGHAQSKSYLVSPATAAASAIEGSLVDPREYLSEADAKRILAAPMARR